MRLPVGKRLKMPVVRRRLIELARHPGYIGGNEVRAMALELLEHRRVEAMRSSLYAKFSAVHPDQTRSNTRTWQQPQS